eukprot:gene20411-biopygen902
MHAGKEAEAEGYGGEQVWVVRHAPHGFLTKDEGDLFLEDSHEIRRKIDKPLLSKKGSPKNVYRLVRLIGVGKGRLTNQPCMPGVTAKDEIAECLSGGSSNCEVWKAYFYSCANMAMFEYSSKVTKLSSFYSAASLLLLHSGSTKIVMECSRNRSVIKVASLRDRHIRKTNGKGQLKVWKGWGAAVSDVGSAL